MIIWSEKLYIGKKMARGYKWARWKLSHGRPVRNVFLITEPTNADNLFDVLPSKELLFPYHKRREIRVYGIAKNHGEAMEMVTRMVEDMYRDTGELCSKEYFVKE